MRRTRVEIKSCMGLTVTAEKLAIFAETDKDGQVFCKMESQYLNKTSAVDIEYDLEKAVHMFTERIRFLLTEQTSKLQK